MAVERKPAQAADPYTDIISDSDPYADIVNSPVDKELKNILSKAKEVGAYAAGAVDDLAFDIPSKLPIVGAGFEYLKKDSPRAYKAGEVTGTGAGIIFKNTPAGLVSRVAVKAATPFLAKISSALPGVVKQIPGFVKNIAADVAASGSSGFVEGGVEQFARDLPLDLAIKERGKRALKSAGESAKYAAMAGPAAGVVARRFDALAPKIYNTGIPENPKKQVDQDVFEDARELGVPPPKRPDGTEIDLRPPSQTRALIKENLRGPARRQINQARGKIASYGNELQERIKILDADKNFHVQGDSLQDEFINRFRDKIIGEFRGNQSQLNAYSEVLDDYLRPGKILKPSDLQNLKQEIYKNKLTNRDYLNDETIPGAKKSAYKDVAQFLREKIEQQAKAADISLGRVVVDLNNRSGALIEGIERLHKAAQKPPSAIGSTLGGMVAGGMVGGGLGWLGGGTPGETYFAGTALGALGGLGGYAARRPGFAAKAASLSDLLAEYLGDPALASRIGASLGKEVK